LKPTLSYPDWTNDFKAAEQKHTIPDYFEDCVHMLTEKQRMHDGIRTHPRLVELDSHSWSYPGWQFDVKMAETQHVKRFRDVLDRFRDMLQVMKKKEQLFAGSRSRSRVEENSQHSKKGLLNGEIAAQSDACVVCMEATRSHAFVPCGHVCMCAPCASKAFAQSPKCPICRNNSQMVMQIFFS
jgi:hypothetical protein